MFFMSCAGAAPRNSSAASKLDPGAALQRALLLGTILGSGAFALTSLGAQAATTTTYYYTVPTTSPVNQFVAGTENLTILSTAAGPITSAAAGSSSASLKVTAADGNITLTLDGAVQSTGTGYAVYAVSGAGSITLTGAGDLTSVGRGIFAQTATGAISLGGTGVSTSGSFNAIYANISSTSATSDILINRSGAMTGARGVFASNSGSGKVTIQGIGAVTATDQGINSSATSGATLIDLTNNVTATVANTSGAGVYATSTSGKITILTAGGVAIKSDTIGIFAQSAAGGDIDIGGAAGLGGEVTGYKAGRTDGVGISTITTSGSTSITLGATSTVNGVAAAIKATSTTGNVTVTNRGTVRGALSYTGGGSANFNNTGTLAVSGTQGNTGFIINNLSGGVLTGDSTGSLGMVNAAAGSIIRPGDRSLSAVGGVPIMGTLNMFTLTLAAGARVELRVDASGVNDKIQVSNDASLGGATLKISATPTTSAAWATSKTFTILTGPSITGTFASTIESEYAYLKFTAAYSATEVTVTGERGWTPFGAYAKSSNGATAAAALDRFQTSSSPLIAKVGVLTVSQAPVALEQLAGAGVTTARSQAFAAVGLVSSTISSEMGRFTGSSGGGSGPMSYAQDKGLKTKAFDRIAPKPEPIADGRVWAHVLGGFGNLKADTATASPSERSTSFGLAAGADTALTPNLRGGFALSGGQSTSKLAETATKADASWGQAAVYGVLTNGALYAKGSFHLGYIASETERTVTAFATPERATGKFGATLYSARFETGRKIDLNGIDVTPFLAFEPSWLAQRGYSETAPTVGLTYGATTARAMPATVGVTFDTVLDLADMRVAPSATVGWVHNFVQSASISPFFTSLPGSTFTVQGARGDRNLARLDLNLEATPNGSLASVYVNARADLGARTNAVRGTAGAMLRF